MRDSGGGAQVTRIFRSFSAWVLVMSVVFTVAAARSMAERTRPGAPGTRVVLDAHNAYPYNGRFADRLGRALAGGLPIAIEQDLVWRPAADGRPAGSIVSHGEPFDGREPSLEEYFFDRIRPSVERELREGNPAEWPVITLNLDLKSVEPEHLRALWELLGKYEPWLTTAVRTPDGSRPAPLDLKPVLVLTGDSEAQARAFHDELAVGSRLRLFGAVSIRPPESDEATRDAVAKQFWRDLMTMSFPRASNYRRWWNAPWVAIEEGGQRGAGDWTADEEARLRTLVGRAHEAGLLVRLWTLNGHPAGEDEARGWSASYNFGSSDAAELRWRAAVNAGADYVATDQYEAFTAVLAELRPRAGSSREIVLEGTLTAADRLAWIEREFEVPPGTVRLDVETDHSHRDAGTALEFGLYDPERFRGASRFSKTRFFVTRDAATPSYVPGPLQPGTWRLLIGIPSIRDGVTSRYRAVVRLTPDTAPDATPLSVPAAAAGTGPRWFMGDFHTHTMHSDGFGCADGAGNQGPCPSYLIADAAVRRGLDFVAITDHNTTSHHAGLVELQMRHERLLLVRGQEVTSFYGHANVFGTSRMVDFRIGDNGRTAADVQDDVARLGGLLVINHPGRETGERCTGCGWNAPNTDYGRLEVMEVVNGRIVAGPTAGEPVWHARLNEGHRITGIGGSDDHGASTRPGSAVGTPTTVVFADALTEPALLAAVRAGRVFIKTRGPDGPDIRFTAPGVGASMGDIVSLDGPTLVTFQVQVDGGRGQQLDVIRNGTIEGGAARPPLSSNAVTLEIPVEVRPGDWVRVNLRDQTGVTVIANPIYFARPRS